MQSQSPLVPNPDMPTALHLLMFAARAELTDIVQDCTFLPRSGRLSQVKAGMFHQASMHEDRPHHQCPPVSNAIVQKAPHLLVLAARADLTAVA